MDNILIGMALGNISHTSTIQHNNSGVFYAYSNIGNSTSSVGVGLNIKDWYGLNAYVSSNIGIGSRMQLGKITYAACSAITATPLPMARVVAAAAVCVVVLIDIFN